MSLLKFVLPPAAREGSCSPGNGEQGRSDNARGWPPDHSVADIPAGWRIGYDLSRIPTLSAVPWRPCFPIAMIVSHSRRFVFVHLHKTAGTSVKQALRPHLAAGDFMTPGGADKPHAPGEAVIPLQSLDKLSLIHI